MSLATMMRQRVTVTTRAPADEDVRGNAPLVAVATVSTVAYFEQTEATEVQVGQDTATSTALVVLDAKVHIGYLDLVTVGDDDWEVVGEPARPFNPRLGRVSHVEARLRRSRG